MKKYTLYVTYKVMVKNVEKMSDEIYSKTDFIIRAYEVINGILNV